MTTNNVNKDGYHWDKDLMKWVPEAPPGFVWDDKLNKWVEKSASINVSHLDLLVLQATSSFKVGQEYRITNFRTTYLIQYYDDINLVMVNEWRYGDVEVLIVTAVSPSQLSHIAYSEDHPDDIIHYKLVDDIYNGYNTATPPVNYGRITYREYPRRNIIMFQDWRQIKFRLYELMESPGLYSISTSINLPARYTRGTSYIETTSFPNIADDFIAYQSIRVEAGSVHPQLVVFLDQAKKVFISPNQDQVVLYDTEDLEVGSCSVLMAESPSNVSQCYFAGGSYYLGSANTSFFGGGTNFYSNGYDITGCNVMSGQTISLERNYLNEMVGYPVAGTSGYNKVFPSQSEPLYLDGTHVGQIIQCNDGGDVYLPATPVDGMTFTFLDTNAGSDFTLYGNGNNVTDITGAGTSGSVVIPTSSKPYEAIDVVWVEARARWVVVRRGIGAGGAGTGDMLKADYDPANISEQLVGIDAVQTLTHKTINDYSNSYIDADALHTKVFNNSGGALVVGSAVYNTQWNAPNGAPEVIKARANSGTSCPCHGLVEEASISDGAVGSIRTAGILNNVNTNAWSDGTDLWLSPTTAGGLTSTEPTTPGQYKQFIGTVVRQHATQGVILVQLGPAVLITGAGSTISGQATVSLGSIPVYSKTVTISDASVSASSKIVATLVRESDEVEFSGVSCAVGVPGSGSFPLTIFSTDGPTSGTFKVNYIVG